MCNSHNGHTHIPEPFVVLAVSAAPSGFGFFWVVRHAQPPHALPPAVLVPLPHTSLQKAAKHMVWSKIKHYTWLHHLKDSFTLLKASTSWARVLSLRAVLVILSLSLSSSSFSLSKDSCSCATVFSFCFSSAVRSFRSAWSYNTKREYIFLHVLCLKGENTFYQRRVATKISPCEDSPVPDSKWSLLSSPGGCWPPVQPSHASAFPGCGSGPTRLLASSSPPHSAALLISAPPAVHSDRETHRQKG